MSEYDVIIIGGGSGGLNALIGSSLLGAKVALIEKDKLGGDCLNYGCVPSKTLINSAMVAHQTRNAEHWGLDAELKKVDFSKIANRIQKVIKNIGKHDSVGRFRRMGIDVIFGDPKFISNTQIKVKGKTLTAKKFVIATGSHPFIPPIKGIEKVHYLTNKNVFSLKKLPKSLGVIGAGPIGCELAQSFARFGSKVTIFEGNDRILAKEDGDVARMMMDIFKEEGINIITNTRVKAVKKKEKNILIIAQDREGKTKEMEVESLLISTGRRPRVESLKLKNAGVELLEKGGGIKVNDKMQTTAKNIYACGDVVGSYQFTHIAEYQAKIIVWNMFFPIKRKADYSFVPWTTFTDPEIAKVGLNEQEARDTCKRCEVYTLEGEEVDRFNTEGYEKGLIKLITEPSGKIRGVTILMPNAGEVIHEFVLAMQRGLNAKDISEMVHIYPTISEGNKKVVNKFMAKKYITPTTKKVAKFFFKYV